MKEYKTTNIDDFYTNIITLYDYEILISDTLKKK